jgi:D-hydroxyproline dehydrogenase subunit beta
MTRVAVIGAGIIGAACALACALRGLSVTVYERGGLVAGTTGSGEGNILVSDKAPGPELDLALRSNELWREWEPLLDRHVPGGIELERKGGLIVTRASIAIPVGIGTPVNQTQVRELEPDISPGVTSGVFFPQDMQVQPARAAVAMLAAARELGAAVRLRTPVTSLGDLDADAIVNATGAWASQFGVAADRTPGSSRERSSDRTPGSSRERSSDRTPGSSRERSSDRTPGSSRERSSLVEPRRGFILVTEPLPIRIRHKVYSADYLDNVASDDSDLQTSTVVEGTPGGPVLIGATRERVGFDATPNPLALRRLAEGAAALFPFLSGVRIMRYYHGFRPFAPDHLPVIGPDPATPGLWHAHGHEGAGIGLAPATGDLIAALVTGTPTTLDAAAFSPGRFVTGVPR